MKSTKCEQMAIAMMAIADGEIPPVSADEVTAHLAECAECREESENLVRLSILFEGQTRSEPAANLWPAINERLGTLTGRDTEVGWPTLLTLGLLLVVFKLVEMVPERELGFLFKLAPLVLVIAIFAYVKENPFRINSELTLEGDR